MTAKGFIVGILAVLALGALAIMLPPWLISIGTIAISSGLVVLGLIVLWRAGLVPFGQALYFATGAYGVALTGKFAGVTDAFALIAIGAAAAGFLAVFVGFLLARYREIFFAMLSLALSMILYGTLVKSEALGSTDGFNVAPATFLGYAPHGLAQTQALFWVALALALISSIIIEAYFSTVVGSLAVPIRDNEIRVEYLGMSVTRIIHLKLVIAAILAGAGGALAAIDISHVDPNMAYWTTSGGFVFVTILAGAGSVPGAFIGALVFELVRTAAVSALPWGWQMILGSVLLITILFLPDGLASLGRQRRAGTTASGAAQ